MEFYKTGQLGWTDNYDPRYSLAFLDVGDVKKANRKPSFVENCAFHRGFAPAVGVFATSRLKMTGNVMYNTVGSAMVVWGDQNEVIDNLMVSNLWAPVFNGRKEKNKKMEAALEIGKLYSGYNCASVMSQMN